MRSPVRPRRSAPRESILLDLTVTNPTETGIPYPPGVLSSLDDERARRYRPEPLGHAEAREAIAAQYGKTGPPVSGGDIVLTASTSEAYSVLFKLLADPGDVVLVPQPSYPLFDLLTRLDGVIAAPVPARVPRRVVDRPGQPRGRAPSRRPGRARRQSQQPDGIDAAARGSRVADRPVVRRAASR